MNLILLHPEDMISSSVAHIRDPRRLDHINFVQGAKAGDTFKAGILNGNMGHALVEAISSDELILQCTLNQAPPAPLPLSLFLGLPRPKMLKRIFQTIATLGVKDLYLLNSYRVEKSYWQTPFLQPDAIQEQLILGLEQGCDTIMPKVHLAKRFKPFVEDELPQLIANTQALVAHPYCATDCPRNLSHPISLAVGPEGGFIQYEVDLLNHHGFQPITLGTRILRVETAIPYLLSRLF